MVRLDRTGGDEDIPEGKFHPILPDCWESFGVSVEWATVLKMATFCLDTQDCGIFARFYTLTRSF